MSDTQSNQASGTATNQPPIPAIPMAHSTGQSNTLPASSSETAAKPDAAKEAAKLDATGSNLKQDDLRRLVIQLGDLTADLKDEALAIRINKLVSQIDIAGRSERAEYRTAIAYAVQDLEKEDIHVSMPGNIRAMLGQLAVTYPGLQNTRMQELVASTSGMEDKAVVKAIRTAAAEIAKQPDQQSEAVTSKVDALANRARLATDPSETTAAQVSAGTATAPQTSASATIKTTSGGQPEEVVSAASPPGGSSGPTGRVMLDIMNALRRPEPENNAAWDKQLTPMGDRITAYNARMQSNTEEADMKRTERVGAVALAAMKEFADGPGAVLMTRIRDAAKADPEGMTGVLAEMREGGRYAGLRQDLTVSLQHEKFAAAYDKALSSVTAFGAERAEVDRFAEPRADSAAIAGRFQKLDADIGKAASELPSKTEGKSFVDDLAQRAQEIVTKAIEVVVKAFDRIRGVSASTSPSP